MILFLHFLQFCRFIYVVYTCCLFLCTIYFVFIHTMYGTNTVENVLVLWRNCVKIKHLKFELQKGSEIKTGTCCFKKQE